MLRLITIAALVLAGFLAHAAEEKPPLEAALANLSQAISEVERQLHNTPAMDAQPVNGYRHMLRALMKGLEAEVLQDPDYPYFRILDFWLREGGDNPDQRYAFTPIRGGEPYRVWGHMGSAARLELQLYAGRPWDGSGRSVGYLNFEEIAVDDAGRFEIWVTPKRRPGSWIENPVEATTLFARHVYNEWNAEQAGEIHIDRIGFEGKRRPPETPEALAAKLDAAATMFTTTALTWPTFVARRHLASRPANTVSVPIDTYSQGGAKGRWLASGHFHIAEDEALVIRMAATEAPYQGIQLTDLWFASLDPANQLSSRSGAQSIPAQDGNYYYVIAGQDPGHPNWLDAGELTQGTFILRWDGMARALAKREHPSASLVPLKSLAQYVPPFDTVALSARNRERAERRTHQQRRANR